MRLIRDWFFSILTMLVFGFVLVTGEIVGRMALRFGWDYERAMGRLQYDLIRTFAISGVTVTTVDRDHLPPGGMIFVSNHQSMFDVPIFGGILREYHPKYVAKSSLASGIPTVSLYLKRGGNALIDRRNPEQAIEAISRMGAACQERGIGAVIFPEGTRSRDGSLGEYRVTGLAALMAAAPDLPIIPTVIDGSWRVFEHNMAPIPYGTEVRVRFGDPITRRADERPEEVSAACRSFAAETLATWQAGS